MPGIVLIGAQWGDEGKGKATDLIGTKVDYVARFNGGNNAGHTVVVGDESYALHLLRPASSAPTPPPSSATASSSIRKCCSRRSTALKAWRGLLPTAGERKRAHHRPVSPRAGQGDRTLPRQA